MGLVKEAMISELKAKLSKYVALVRGGETVVVRDRNTPVARLVPYQENTDRLQLERASLSPEELANLTPVRLRKSVDLVKELRHDRDAR